MRTTYLLNIIIVCLAFIMSLFTIKTQNNFHSGYSEEGYTYNYIEPNDTTSETKDLGQPTESHPKMIHTLTDEKVPAGEEKTATVMTESFYYEMGDVRLIGEPGSLKENVLLSINGLDTNILPSLNAGMVNVTADYAAYRMLPHGTIFNKDIEVVLPYDTALLPMGFTANDIKSYYYDERYGSWIEIERDSVDKVNHLIISRVNHFTDFINAVIKTPEMPETSAYVPTVMSDIKAANPLEGINLMQPPKANNKGTANISYPLEIPAGRNGMQPNLTLTYNSSGENGWLGLGWDISIPAITVETRWGVPRYDASKESEVYLLNGEQLATKDTQGNYNQLAHRADWVNRMRGDVQFYPRTEGAFQQIIRHGTTPKNYWWEVRDKNGLIYYYGKKLGVDSVDYNAVLKTPISDIAEWGLTEIRDLNGNFVYYSYSVAGRYDPNKYFYLKSITYTGNGITEGAYRIEFSRKARSAFEFSDISSNCRYGLRKVEMDLLHTIKIYFNDSLFKGFAFCYTSGAFGKTLLKSISEPPVETLLDTSILKFCEDNKEIALNITHDFSYYQKPDTLFGEPISINRFNDLTGAESGIAENSSFGWSVGGTLAVGLGTGVYNILNSVGGSYTYSKNSTKGVLDLIDINGDGFPDKFYKKNNHLYYRTLVPSPDYSSFSFSDDNEVPRMCNFLNEDSKTNSWGVEACVGIGPLSVSAAYDRGTTVSTINAYMCDVNADGFPDIVFNGLVFLNQKNSDGRRYFNTASIDTIWSGGTCGIDTGFVMENYFIDPEMFAVGNKIVTCHYVEDYLECDTIYITGFESFMPDLEAVRVWIAPSSGYIHLSGDAFLTEDMDSIRNLSGIKDGVKISVQHNGTLVKSQIIKSDSIFVLNNQLSVTKGDRLYFRMESLTSRLYDKVYWNPQIEYIYMVDSISNYDADGKHKYVFKASEDFLVSKKQKLQMPFSGNVYIKNNFTISDSLSTDIVMKIYKNENILYQRTFPQKNRATFNFDTLVTVSQGDSIDFKVTSFSNVKWNSVRWIPRVYYDTITSPDTIPAYEYDTNPNVPTPTVEYSPVPYFGVFERTLIPTKAYSFGNIPNAQISPKISFSQQLSGSITLSIKSDLYGKEYEASYVVSNGNVNIPSPLPTIPIYSNRIYYIDYSTDNISLAEALTTVKCKINLTAYDAGLHTHYPDSMYKFGNLYRNWGQFTYQKDTINGALINENLLNLNAALNTGQLDTSTLDTSRAQLMLLDQQLANMGCYDPLATNFIPMEPNVKDNYWSGYGLINYMTPDTMSNTYNLKVDTTIVDNIESPFPILQEGKKSFAINKQSIGKTNAVGLNAGISQFSGGINFVWGWNEVASDFIDLNGDRYPDILILNSALYTKPQGGYLNEVIGLEEHYTPIDRSNNFGIGNSFGCSFLELNKETKSNVKNNSASISGNFGFSNSVGTQENAFIDINGDGLPDKVKNDGSYMHNLGYQFNYEGSLIDPNENEMDLNKNVSHCDNSGVNFNLWNGSIAGGLNLSNSIDITKTTLIDINGDGLPDMVNDDGVNFNTGIGFKSTNLDYPNTFDKLSTRTSQNAAINLAVTFGFAFWIIKLVLNPKGNISWGMNQTNYKLIDINADGYPDIVEDDISHSSIKVSLNQIGETNLLHTVNNLANGSFTIGYELSKNNIDCPNRTWTMNTLIVYDGHTGDGKDRQYFSFSYDSARYDRFERENFGFKVVKTRQDYVINVIPETYRILTEKYHNEDYMRKGLKYYELLADTDNNKYVEKIYDYRLKEISSGDTINAETYFCYGAGYPALFREIVNYYEGNNSAQITTKKQYEHGPYGNIKTYYNFGDINVSDDDFYAEIYYHIDTTDHNIVGIQDSMVVKNYTNASILRKRAASINNNGQTTQIRLYNNNLTSVYDLLYDPLYGNITQMTYPPNHNNQRMYFEYTYDNIIHQYPITIKNALNYTSSTTYDYKWGKPLVSTDINGNSIFYEYDSRGRISKIKSPYENDYTLKFDYCFGNSTSSNYNTLWARTEHYDSQHAANPISTILFTDALGRVIQTKKDIEINGTEYRSVSGKVNYDNLGRQIEFYYPVVESITIGDSIFNLSVDTINPTVFKYDILDRKDTIIMPDNNQTTMIYGVGTDAYNITRFTTITKDANFNIDTVFSDPRKLQTTIISPMGTANSFLYNPLGELINSTDPDGHSTDYEYDMLGQKVTRVHPDAGIDTWQYDCTGNIISRQTQNLQNNNDQWIEYEYNYNQLTHINYPENPENNVIYEYGAMGDPYNRAGKIVRQEDASGYQEFSYGALGEITENIRTFVLPNENGTYTFAMNFEYDSWNRILNMTYPDGEVVKYKYNVGGLLSSMTGFKENATYPYIDSIQYNKFEAKTEIYYGNGTYAVYDYDTLQRLKHLTSSTFGGEIMQDIEYTFDNVNNIIQIVNGVGPLLNGLGGNYESNYTYDNLYRLTNDTGYWNNGTNLTFNLSMEYAQDGRIVSKRQNAMQLLNGIQTSISYNNTYNYNSGQPHTLNNVIDSGSVNQNFAWDANGNLVFHANNNQFGTRRLCWDEENRIMGVADDNFISYYMYDAGGERTYKLTGAFQDMIINGQQYNFNLMNNPTLYTSPYLVATPQGYTKHFYAGSERILSKIGCGGLSKIDVPFIDLNLINEKISANYAVLESTVNQCLEKNPEIIWDNLKELYELKEAQCEDEKDLYYYHPDHLGSGTWVTYTDGRAIQHLHYLPFGEEQIDQRLTNFNSRYTFSAKEKDIETGYSYFGARYYTSDLSIWLSVDPMSDKLPSLTPYNYCINNPVKLIDPNGEIPWPIAKNFNNAIRQIISGMYRNFDGQFHGATDIVHNTNTGNISGGTVVATHNGVVTQSGKSKTAGNWIQITNGDIRTTYMHMEKAPTQQIGDVINEGDQVGTVGNTGRSKGPHLHYQIEMYNEENKAWEKTNPVEGDPDKVDLNSNVILKDPQKYINYRDGKSQGSNENQPILLKEIEVKSSENQ